MNILKAVFQALFQQKRARQGQAGFSLIELLVVVSIMGDFGGYSHPAVYTHYQGNRPQKGQLLAGTLSGIKIQGFLACTALD